ncbi:hypothetical protein SAMN06265379_11710 [Saccharicrinis carchari]|uniref:Uncharacterized protein n=1 Tax=Saccharicrinis carchari TaxID=1168039 RepID=A0A521F9R0_SACCC|nr:hypothetical protein [Saccharicrinis carchari]SMO92857.1 hypothetical protein SAMN06265379_11710 [Saccharicrinis carchari]
MKQYIYNLIPRLKQYSANLDKKEVFIEIPWVIVDDDLNVQKYIFRRDGDLIMSNNGQVKMGKWEYLSSAKSILIDRIQDKILLNQNFVDPAVMILKKDGFKDENLFLANEVLLPDLNIGDYLKKLYYQKNKISEKLLKSGKYFELYDYNGYMSNNKVTIEGEFVADGKYELSESGRKYLIKDSRVIKVLVEKPYKTDKGIIIIEIEEYSLHSKGDLVMQNGSFAPDGRYRLGFMSHITVKDGRIIKF